jgi:hypothetical protein
MYSKPPWPLLAEPALEVRLVLGQVDARDPDLVEAEFDGDRVEPLAQSREIQFGEGTGHAGTGGGVRPV